MKVYRTSAGTVAEVEGTHYSLERVPWSGLLASADPVAVVTRAVESLREGGERAQPTPPSRNRKFKFGKRCVTPARNSDLQTPVAAAANPSTTIAPRH